MNLNAPDRLWRRMATIASILLLTTACGGGGNDPSSSEGPSSPGLRTKTTAKNPPRETMTEPITADAVRGDVLATALTQLAVGPVNGKPARVEVLESYDRVRPHHTPRTSPYYIEHMIGPDTTGHGLGRYVSDQRYYHHFYKEEKPEDPIQIQMGLSNTGPLPPATASSAPDDVLLTVGRKLILTFSIPKRADRYSDTVVKTRTLELNAPADVVIRRHDRQTELELIEWVSSDPSIKASLILRRHDTVVGKPRRDNEFMTCTRLIGNTNCKDCPDVEQRHDICTTWMVPEGWQAGQPLVPKNMFIQEEGEDFLNYGWRPYTLYWYTAGPAPFDDTVNVDMPRWRTRRPVSFWGVRGDLFSTMIDSMTRRGQGIPAEVAGPLNAVERLNRKKPAEATVPQQLYFYASTDANFYADGQPLTAPGYSPSNGLMTWYMNLFPQGSQTSPFLSAKVELKADVRPVFGRESLVLDRYLPGSIFWERNSPGKSPIMMAVHRKSPTLPKLFAIPRDALVPFGTVRSWVGENEDRQRLITSLQLRHGPRPRQVDLCWRQWLSNGEKNAEKLVNRLSCVRWAVPRDWRHGQGLKAISAYVVDRSRHPEPTEPATRIWQSFTRPADPATRP